MWQRIQSVFLGIAILSLLAGLLFPIWIGGDSGVEYRLYPIYFMIKQNGRITTSQYFPYSITAILMAAAATIAITEIRRFDNRILQVKLGTLNSLLLAGVMICDVIFANQMSKTYAVAWNYDLSLYFTFAAVVGNWLAIRFIRRDEKVVRDSNKIR
jgi:hypothetical protein